MKTILKLIVFAALPIAFTMLSCQKDDTLVLEPAQNSGTIITSGQVEAQATATVGLPDSFGATLTQYEYPVGPASQLNLKYPAMSREQWNSNLILTFMMGASNTAEVYYAVPGIGASGNYWMYKNDKETGSVIVFLDSRYNPVISRDYSMAKILIIEPAGERTRYSRRTLIENLERAGVDLKDYRHITQYFGI